MKNSDFLIDFNNSVKKGFNDREINSKINSFFELIKSVFPKYKIQKLGDFKYNTLDTNCARINIDIAFVIYANNRPLPMKVFSSILEKAEKFKKFNRVKTYGNLIQIAFKSENKKYLFNSIIVFSDNNLNKDYVIENENWTEEQVLKVTNDMIVANKVSSNFLFSIKKIINYLIGDSFIYSYNIDYMLLRCFYEYSAKTVKEFVSENESNTLDIENFLKPKNLSSWLKRRVNFRDLGFYILNSMLKTTTYYYSHLENKNIEIFEGVSRYSLNSLTGFSLPTNYYSQIKLFNIKKFQELQTYQSNMKIDSGYSISAFDNARQNDYSIVCTPELVEGVANINLLRYALKEKAKSIYALVSEDKRKEIVSSRSREHLEYLNQLAYNFLSGYKNKIEYLKIYFDKKYPLINNRSFIAIVDMIKTIVKDLNDADWVMQNDF